MAAEPATSPVAETSAFMLKDTVMGLFTGVHV